MTLPNFPNNPTLGQTFNVGNATYECTKVVSGSAKAEWRVVGQADKGLRAELANPDSMVPIANHKAFQLGNISGNADKKHFSIGAIPKCNNLGVFELISDAAHNPMNVASVTQPDQYTIRINYAKTATKINSFIVAPDAELAPYGVVCGGDVGTAFANIKCFAPFNFIADNNSPTPSIVLNDLWSPSLGVGSITATKLNDSTLRVTHPPTVSNEPPAVTIVSANNIFDFIASYGLNQIDITCIGNAQGYISYSTSWSQAFSRNVASPTLSWTENSTLKVDLNQTFSGLAPKLTPQGSTYIPVVVNYGSTFFEVAFMGYDGIKATTQNANMTFWYELGLKLPCIWPAGNIVSVQRGMLPVPSYNFKGVVGNNLWVKGEFEE